MKDTFRFVRTSESGNWYVTEDSGEGYDGRNEKKYRIYVYLLWEKASETFYNGQAFARDMS